MKTSCMPKIRWARERGVRGSTTSTSHSVRYSSMSTPPPSTASPFLNCGSLDALISLKITDFMCSCVCVHCICVYAHVHAKAQVWRSEVNLWPHRVGPGTELRSGLVAGTPAESSHLSNCNRQMTAFKGWESKQR